VVFPMLGPVCFHLEAQRNVGAHPGIGHGKKHTPAAALADPEMAGQLAHQPVEPRDRGLDRGRL
jgi:hypothetical protein